MMSIYLLTHSMVQSPSWAANWFAASQEIPRISRNPKVHYRTVTTAWRVLRLRTEERPPLWRVAANKLNKQSRTADEGWSSSLGVGRGANNPSL